MQDILVKAIEAAKKSNCRQKHGAVLFYGKKIYAIGFNDYKINKMDTCHAEVSSIINLLKSRRFLRKKKYCFKC